MKYELTQHAVDALANREIKIEWMERVLENPDKIETDSVDAELEHRLARILEYNNRVLRVIIKPSVEPVRIITVYFDRGLRDKL